MPRLLSRLVLPALLALGSGMAQGQTMPDAAAATLLPGLHGDVVFDRYSPLARSEEMLGRLMSPLWNERMHDKIATSEQALVEQSLTLVQERFTVYFPKGDKPAEGYALLVFIMPWDKAKFPSRWLSEFDKHSVIAVTASNSGNDRNVLERRIPLALSAYENIAQRYALNRSRVYIGGLSGGSRVALRIALGYPEIFTGALLNAGSDRFGSDILPLPTQTLFQRFEEHTRLVYATGTLDETNLVIDAHSRDSARALCISDLVITPMRNLGHAPVDAATLDHALSALEAPPAPRTELAECRRHRSEEIRGKLAAVQSQIDAGKTDAAIKQLIDIDLDYGGLAAPKSIELAHRLGLHVQPPPHESATKH